MTDRPVPDAAASNVPDPLIEAKALTQHARALDKSRYWLRDHPEQVYDVLEAIEEATLYLDSVVEEASSAYQTHGGTAVTMFGDQAEGSRIAVYAAGYLKAAAHTVRSLRDMLMRGTAEVDRLSWPQHDPVAAEQIREYRQLLDKRAQHIDPDQPEGAGPSSAPKRGTIEP